MILFPIALAWLVFVVLWAVRHTVEPSDGPWRPWRQRIRPHDGPHGRPRRGGPDRRPLATGRSRPPERSRSSVS